MTPKEKAQNLIDEFLNADYTDIYYDGAKQCALIAVDEIMSALEYLDDDSESFWFEVKKEILNL